ncbi:M20 family metallo-hydrolase [candidate division KSB1 bacterium]|nr:M20 family metallo-hydrolase [candidate division KSB1 bacterium]
MTDQNALSSCLQQIDEYRQSVIDMQSRLVAIPALGPENGGQGEKEKAEFVESELKRLGIDEIETIRVPDKRVQCGYRPNIIARLPGKRRDRTLWIMAHLDVVPAGDPGLWQTNPFELTVDGDRLIGRGVEDNHQGLVSALMAVKAFRATATQPEQDLGLAIVADEETGSLFGLHHLLENRSDLFGTDDWIIVPDAGDPQGRFIEVAEKTILWIRFHLRGKQCHASTPAQGVNAHRAAANLIVRLDELHRFFDRVDPVFDPPTTTFEPTKKESNVQNINTIPGDDVFYLDCRILPSYDIKKVEAKVKEISSQVQKQFGVEIDISFPQRAVAAPPTAKDAPVVQALGKAIREIKGIQAETIGIGGGTVAAHFREKGFPTAVWSTIEDTAHQPNEVSLISSTLEDAQVFTHLLLQNPDNRRLL